MTRAFVGLLEEWVVGLLEEWVGGSDMAEERASARNVRPRSPTPGDQQGRDAVGERSVTALRVPGP